MTERSTPVPSLLGRIMLSLSLLATGALAGLLLGGPGRDDDRLDRELLQAGEALIRAEVTAIWESGLLAGSILDMLQGAERISFSVDPSSRTHFRDFLLPFADMTGNGLAELQELAHSTTLPRLGKEQEDLLESLRPSLDYFASDRALALLPLLGHGGSTDDDSAATLQALADCMSLDAMQAAARGDHSLALARSGQLLTLISSFMELSTTEADFLLGADLVASARPGVTVVLSSLPAEEPLAAPINLPPGDDQLYRNYALRLSQHIADLLEQLPPAVESLPPDGLTRNAFVLRLDMAVALRSLRQMAEDCSLPASLARQALAARERNLEAMSMPPFTLAAGLDQDAAERLIRCQAALDMMVLADGLARYRFEHGSLPRRLEELVPGQLDVLPLDPELGAGYEYDPSAPGFGLARPGVTDGPEHPVDMARGPSGNAVATSTL